MGQLGVSPNPSPGFEYLQQSCTYCTEPRINIILRGLLLKELANKVYHMKVPSVVPLLNSQLDVPEVTHTYDQNVFDISSLQRVIYHVIHVRTQLEVLSYLCQHQPRINSILRGLL